MRDANTAAAATPNFQANDQATLDSPHQAAVILFYKHDKDDFKY
jgi:hypothetical protein